MKRQILYTIVAVLAFIIVSCSKDFLETEPQDQFAASVTWDDPYLMQAFVFDIYAGLIHEGGWITLACGVDEAHSANIDEGIQVKFANQSKVSATDMLLWSNNFWSADSYKRRNWANVYPEIRRCNIFLANSSKPTNNPSLVKQLRGEVFFLRAYYYLSLVSLYGGVPIVDKVYTLGDDFAVPRNTVEECFAKIVADCDSAVTLLPASIATGRAPKGAAHALKSRALLYAASDFYSDPSWAGSFANPGLISYPPGNRATRWEAARNAAKALIDLNLYSLYKGNPAPGDSIAKDYSSIFTSKTNVEHIFVRHFLKDGGGPGSLRGGQGWDQYNPGKYNSPTGWAGWGGATPIGQLVDDFEMKDGSRFDWNNPVHAATPYKNRDRRFYATVLYDGAVRSPRPPATRAADPVGAVQTGYYEVWDAGTNSMKLVPGLDTRDRQGVESWNATWTGYYMRKGIDETIDVTFFENYQECPWIYFRYAEILLNYAEACNALGQDPEAQWAINLVRKRAGQPATSKTGAELKALIRNERRVELAYEDQRFFDVRRWMIAPSAYTNVKGVNIRYKLNPDRTTSTIPTVTIKDNVVERSWSNKYYLLPIKFDEMAKNSMLVQNPLY